MRGLASRRFGLVAGLMRTLRDSFALRVTVCVKAFPPSRVPARATVCEDPVVFCSSAVISMSAVALFVRSMLRERANTPRRATAPVVFTFTSRQMPRLRSGGPGFQSFQDSVRLDDDEGK